MDEASSAWRFILPCIHNDCFIQAACLGYQRLAVPILAPVSSLLFCLFGNALFQTTALVLAGVRLCFRVCAGSRFVIVAPVLAGVQTRRGPRSGGRGVGEAQSGARVSHGVGRQPTDAHGLPPRRAHGSGAAGRAGPGSCAAAAAFGCRFDINVSLRLCGYFLLKEKPQQIRPRCRGAFMYFRLFHLAS